MEKINKILNNGFSDIKVFYEKVDDEYIVYQKYNFFWVKFKSKVISCRNFETLKEVDNRCNLGLFEKFSK
jgi:hypothetical protein